MFDHNNDKIVRVEECVEVVKLPFDEVARYVRVVRVERLRQSSALQFEKLQRWRFANVVDVFFVRKSLIIKPMQKFIKT